MRIPPPMIMLAAWIHEGPFFTIGYVWLEQPKESGKNALEIPLGERLETLCLN